MLSEYDSDSDSEPETTSASTAAGCNNNGKASVRAAEPSSAEPPRKKACLTPEKQNYPTKNESVQLEQRPLLPQDPFGEAPQPQPQPQPVQRTVVNNQTPAAKSPVCLVPPQIWKKTPNAKAVDF